MWQNVYKDYPEDTPFVRQSVEPGKGIVGCEMHDMYGWQEKQHIPLPRKPGILFSFKRLLLGRKKR